jgi:1A family penicillin-binding protein
MFRLTAAGALFLTALFAYLWLSTPLPAPDELQTRIAPASTRIVDRKGRLIYDLPDPLSGRRQILPLDAIPHSLREATIAIEDAGFYANPGVDLRGMLRALRDNLQQGDLVAGGSTITQQLARNLLLDPELARQRTLERKLREAVLALKLTASYSKDDILALYLNQTYYGALSYGVEAAAQRFFGKPASELSLAESALLAGLPQAPATYDPLKYPDAARTRQQQVLAAMIRVGSISQEQADQAFIEPLHFIGAPAAMHAPHAVQMVLDEADALLGPDMLARGGWTITTTLDLGLQQAAEEALRYQIALLGEQRDGVDHNVRNGAVVVLDPANGAILALVGSPNFADDDIQGQVNAALALRQPGSAIKPLTYAAALEYGWTPATLIMDVPTAFPTREGRAYRPLNYDRTFHGPLTLREALATSSNVAAVQTLNTIGLPALLGMAERLGMTSLGADQGRYGLSLTLGGGEVTLLELTSAYAAFANGGNRVTPFLIQAIERSNEPHAPSATLKTPEVPPPVAALDPRIAYVISDILSDRYARMRAFGSESVLDLDRPAAAKTGTTSDWRDNWTIGYTPDRVVGVWVGNADGEPMELVSGITGAGPIWRQVMQAAHQGLPPRPFQRPDGILEREICADSGLLPSPTCPATRPERFLAGTEPTRPDDTHIALLVDRELGCRAPQSYPVARVVRRVYRILPPAAEDWGADHGIAHIPDLVCPPLPGTPDIQDDTEPPAGLPISADPTPRVLYPAPGTIYALDRSIPADRQRIEVRAQAGQPVQRLRILLDGMVLESFSAPPYRAFWALTPGRHTLQVEVTDLQEQVLRSPPVEFEVLP